MFLRNLLFTIITLSLVACGKDSPEDGTTLDVLPDMVLLECGNGATNTFEIICNDAWTVTESADWLELSDGSGMGNAEVTATATSENTSTEPRSTVVTIKAGDNTKDITVEQSGAEPEVIVTEVYDLAADGTGSTGAVFSLSGTQEGVSYTLLHDGEPVGIELEGTGSAAAFKGFFSADGVYTARSIAGEYEQTDMNGSFTIDLIDVSSFIYYATEYSAEPTIGIYKYDMDSEVETKLTGIATDITCMEYIDGTIYGITYDYDPEESYNSLITIDMETGALTSIKSHIAADGIGLAYNIADGKTYVSTWDMKFGSIDLVTGDYTNIGTTPYSFTIAIDNGGVCYAQSFNDYFGDGEAHFGTLNLSNGNYSEILATDDMINFIQNMSVDRVTDELYWMQRNDIQEGSGIIRLVKINKATGTYTEVKTFTNAIQAIAIVSEAEYTVTPTAE